VFERSIDSIARIYAVVIGVALSASVKTLITEHSSGDPDLSSRIWIGMPAFVAFVVTLVPFWHGMNRHLDRSYLEKKQGPAEQGSLLIDFLIFFLEAILLFIAGSSLRHDDVLPRRSSARNRYGNGAEGASHPFSRREISREEMGDDQRSRGYACRDHHVVSPRAQTAGAYAASSTAVGVRLRLLLGFLLSQSAAGRSDLALQRDTGLDRQTWAILGNARWKRWQIWQCEQRMIYNLQMCQGRQGFESHPHRAFARIAPVKRNWGLR